MSELLDIYDLARRYKVSIRTIWRWLSNGKLPQPDVVRGVKIYWTRGLLDADEKVVRQEKTGERSQEAEDRRQTQGKTGKSRWRQHPLLQ